MMKMSPWTGRNIRKLLCIRLDNFGDVLMCTPAMRALKESLPGCRLTLLTSSLGSGITGQIPLIEETIVFAAPWIKSSPPTNGRTLDAMTQNLKARSFDAAVIFTTYTQSALPAAMLCFQAGIPLRLAYCHENPYQIIQPWIRDPEPETFIRHEVERQLDLVKAVGCRTRDKRLVLRYSPDAKTRVREFIKQHLGDSNNFYVLHAGASAYSRRYSLRNYAAVIRCLAENGWQAILTGSLQERDSVHQLQDMTGSAAIDAAGHFSLEDLSALIDASPLLISNNTGPAHIAAAVGTPVVVLYAQTNMQHFPWTTRSRVLYHDVPCKNCFRSVCPKGHHHCLELVRPQHVAEVARSILQSYDQTTDKEMESLCPNFGLMTSHLS